MKKRESRRLHDNAMWNREALQHSESAGCFGCLEIYPAAEVVSWCAEPTRDGGAMAPVTALCPRCGGDSVLPSATVVLSRVVLQRMQRIWFSNGDRLERLTPTERKRQWHRHSARELTRRMKD